MDIDELPVDLSMVCVCAGDRRAAADSDRARIAAALSRPPRFVVTDADFVTAVIRSLATGFVPAGNVKAIHYDQCFAILVEDSNDDRVVVACDRVEDGLARIWAHFHDRRAGRRVHGATVRLPVVAAAPGIGLDEAQLLVAAGELASEDGQDVDRDVLVAYRDARRPR